ENRSAGWSAAGAGKSTGPGKVFDRLYFVGDWIENRQGSGWPSSCRRAVLPAPGSSGGRSGQRRRFRKRTLMNTPRKIPTRLLTWLAVACTALAGRAGVRGQEGPQGGAIADSGAAAL